MNPEEELEYLATQPITVELTYKVSRLVKAHPELGLTKTFSEIAAKAIDIVMQHDYSTDTPTKTDKHYEENRKYLEALIKARRDLTRR